MGRTVVHFAIAASTNQTGRRHIHLQTIAGHLIYLDGVAHPRDDSHDADVGLVFVHFVT